MERKSIQRAPCREGDLVRWAPCREGDLVRWAPCRESDLVRWAPCREGKSAGRHSRPVQRRESSRDSGGPSSPSMRMTGSYRATVAGVVIFSQSRRISETSQAGALLWGCVLFPYIPYTAGDCFVFLSQPRQGTAGRWIFLIRRRLNMADASRLLIVPNDCWGITTFVLLTCSIFPQGHLFLLTLGR